MKSSAASWRPFKIILPCLLVFLGAQFLLRCALLVREWASIDVGAMSILKAFAVGTFMDCMVSLHIITLIFLLRLFVPPSWRHRSPDRLLMAVVTALVAIGAAVATVADWLFWEDIGARINFMALDYLFYPEEVIGFLRSAYPLHIMIPALLVVVSILCAIAYRYVVPVDPDPRPRAVRWAHAGVVTSLSLICLLTTSNRITEVSVNHYVNEIAKTGMYNFFDAIAYYDRPYEKYYPSSDRDTIGKHLHQELSEPYATFVNDDPWDITRRIQPPGSEKRSNVILVIMESMSASFMGCFGNPAGLTPELDKLSSEALFFDNCYSAGMRTVRGVEAVSLSNPPQPGPAVVKRPDNANLATLGWVFRDRGYDTRFGYNGFARFDSMEGYVSNNGFDILDRRSFSEDEITFENSWGVCDEDIFMKAISEADAAHERKQPFMYMILTMSNHRPFTFPEGKIEVPEGLSERLAAAKYADYAVGQLIKEAKKHPWFDDTIFVFISDHASISTGNREITLEKHRIPLIFYAPQIVGTQRNQRICCHLDLAPTLLGILNFDYYSRFYGHNLLLPSEERALVSNFEKLGYFDGNILTVLRPDGSARAYSPDGRLLGPADKEREEKTISFYQHGVDWRNNKSRIPTVAGAG